MIKRLALHSLIILPIIMLLVIQNSIADDDEHYDVKQLKEAGEIMSLEMLLKKLAKHDIDRLLEVELERENNRYIYEIEYIDTQGTVYELEVDAISAKVLKTEREH